MCRYAMTLYKPHYACFKCQKSFKRRLLKDIEGGFDDSTIELSAKCPDCGNLMADMGLDFEAPKKKDDKAWKHLATLFQVGITFHSCGCSGPGFIPRNQNELINYFEKIKSDYLKHQHFWAQRGEDPVGQSETAKDEHFNSEFLFSIPREMKSGTRNNIKYDSGKAQVYWHTKVKEVEMKIDALTNANNV